MNKEKFLEYFLKKSQSKDETNGIQITIVLTLVTENVTSTDLSYAEEEMQNTYKRSKKYKVEILATIMKEVGLYGRDFGTASAIRKFTTKYRNIVLSEPQVTPGRTSAMIVTEPLSRELKDPTF